MPMEESEKTMTSATVGLQRMFKHIPESKGEKCHNLLNIAPIDPNHPKEYTPLSECY